MTFLQIMREAYRARRAGVSVQVALMSVLDDDDWEVLWQRLMEAARLDSALKKYQPRGRR
jgi:hypothetical protein